MAGVLAASFIVLRLSPMRKTMLRKSNSNSTNWTRKFACYKDCRKSTRKLPPRKPRRRRA